MTIQSVSAVFFSPTGATRTISLRLADELARRANVPLSHHDFTLPAARETAPAFSEGALVVFGVPVYAGRVPNLLVTYIEGIKGGGAFAVPLVLYGNRAFDDALIELQGLLEAGGFRTLAGCAFVGEHSFGRSLAAGRPDGEDLLAAAGFAGDVFGKLALLQEGEPHRPTPLPGNDPPAPYFRPTDPKGNFLDIRRVKPVTTEDCIGCKSCAAHCPMGSINVEDVRQVTGICIKCNACVKQCPMGAKHFTDPAYLYHRDDILTRYAFPRRAPMLFL